jgi:hypothetical protein
VRIPDPNKEISITLQINPQVSFLHNYLSTDLGDQELGRLTASLITVGQVSRSDGQGTSADEISSSAEDLEPVGGVVGDSTAVLQVLGVSEEHGADNLVTNGRVQVADGGGCESSSLTKVIVNCVQESWHEEAYEYPPATTLLVGHLELAKFKRRTISAMEAGVEPRGRRLPPIVASYGPPTPWTQTLAAPYLLSRALPRGAPRVPFTTS